MTVVCEVNNREAEAGKVLRLASNQIIVLNIDDDEIRGGSDCGGPAFSRLKGQRCPCPDRHDRSLDFRRAGVAVR